MPETKDDLPSDPTERLVGVHWASQFLGVPIQTLYVWRHRGEGPPAYKIGRHLRYRPSEISEWVTKQAT